MQTISVETCAQNGSLGIDGAVPEMEISPNEDNLGAWQAFSEAFGDDALMTDLYREDPEIQVAKFRSIFEDENRKFLRNLDVEKVSDEKDET